jgi:hypothetical protein
MGVKIIIGLQEIKDLTPGKYVSEAEFIGLRLGVAFGLRLLEACGYVEIEPEAKAELKKRVDTAIGRGENARRRSQVTVGWFNGLYNLIRLSSENKAIEEELKELFPLDSISRL